MASSTPALSSTGLGSGLDVNTIVTKLMSIEQRPLTLLKNSASDLGAKLSSFGKLQSNFSAMRDKANALTNPDLWKSTKSSSADDTAVAVSATGGAAAGSYEVEVGRLAAAQTVVTPPLPGSGATLSEGEIKLEIGKWIDTPAPMFDPRVSNGEVKISIGPGETALGTVRDKINAAGVGIVATVINDAQGARLMLRSGTTGEASAFRITVNEKVDDGQAGAGLSMLAYDAHAASPATRVKEAADAQLKVNGIDIQSPTNTVTGAVDGVTLTLKKPTTAPVPVSVAQDTETMKKAVTEFVAAYNTTATYLRTQMAYNADTKVAGELQGDAGARTLQQQMRAVVNQTSTASSSYGTLSSLGIAMQADGTLSVDDTKLTKALANPEEVRKALTADGATSAESGFVRRFKRLSDAALGADGLFEARTSGLKSQVTRNTKDQTAMQTRLDTTEARLRAQYQSLDGTMARMTALSSYVSAQVAKWG